MAINIFLAGEEHHKHEYRLAGINLIKQLAAEKAITTLSLELEFDRYQHILDSFSFSHPSRELVDYASHVYVAKKNHLDVIASDYRDSLAGHLIQELRKLDDAMNIQDSDKEKILISYLQPLSFDNSSPIKAGDKIYDEFYNKFSSKYASAQDLFDFLNITYYEERERFTINLLSSYLKRKPDSRILHICGLDHVAGLKDKFINEGLGVDVLDLITSHK